MPLSAIIDVIERLILNKAEPSVIKGNLVLLRDQAEEVERRLRTFESRSESEQLDAMAERQAKELDAVRAELANALDQIERLQADEVQRRNKGKRRSKVEEDVLMELSMRGEMSYADFQQHTSISFERAEVCLSDLQKAELVYPQTFAQYPGEPHQPTLWHIAIEGTRYLLDYGLIK